MSVDRILYDALDVPVNASSYHIRQAYVNKSNTAVLGSQEFELIKAAYKVLMTPDLRRLYDESGLAGLNQLFESEEKQAVFHLEHDEEASHGSIKAFAFSISIEDSFKGGTFAVDFPWTFVCTGCRGIGTLSGQRHPLCRTCKGTGKTHTIIPGFGATSQVCVECFGRGEIESEMDLCRQCYGRKCEEGVMRANVDVPAGSQHGDILKIAGNDDVRVIIKIKKDAAIRINGKDLIVTKKLTLTQCLLGFAFPMKTLSGKDVFITSQDVVEPGTSICVSGHGYCERGEHETRGDLIIQFDIILPKPTDIGPYLTRLFENQQYNGVNHHWDTLTGAGIPRYLDDLTEQEMTEISFDGFK